MNYEFQVVYRELHKPDLIETGDPKTLNVIAPDDEEARAIFTNDGFAVLAVTMVRPVVDWNKPVWDLDEFGAALGIKGKTLSGRKGDGKFPWNSKVGGVPRRVAMKFIEGGLNEAGRNILDELD